MKRTDFDCDADGFFGEVLQRLDQAKDSKETRVVLEKMTMAVRSRTFADVAFIIEDLGADPKIVQDTLRMAAMFYPEMEWKVLGDLLYPKDGPFMKRLFEAVKNTPKRPS